LRMSESLLFLSRRGFEGTLTPSESMNGLTSPTSPSIQDPRRDLIKQTTDEKFLGSVSAFIRRCFEYADPDDLESEVKDNIDAFSIGDDEDEEDLLDLSESKSTSKSSSKTAPVTEPVMTDPLSDPTPPGSPSLSAQPHLQQQNSSSRAASHNLALDPSKPLHITLPTFRMVILADELLEQFFETFFPQSFHLSSTPNTSTTSLSASTLSGNLTTFANLGTPVKNLMSSVSSNKTVVDVGQAGGVVEPGSRGLRGVLDNIVNDGMRMAAEMRKRMDETQREFEKNARENGQKYKDDEDEEEEYDEKAMDIGRRDQDLLEGAEVASIKTMRLEDSSGRMRGSIDEDTMMNVTGSGSGSTGTSLLDMPRQVEFEL